MYKFLALSNGSVTASSGSVTASNGSVAPSNGSATPSNGSVAVSNRSATPSNGSVMVSNASVALSLVRREENEPPTLAPHEGRGIKAVITTSPAHPSQASNLNLVHQKAPFPHLDELSFPSNIVQTKMIRLVSGRCCDLESNLPGEVS